MEKEWEELTPEEKRGERFKQWYEAKEIQFKNKEAKKSYQKRVMRFTKAHFIEEPDRVPVNLPTGYFPAYYSGYNLHTVLYDNDKLRSSWLKFFNDFKDDLDSFSGPVVGCGQAMDIMDYKFSKWPGHGLSTDSTSQQIVERENMHVNEYDSLINNPSDWAVRVFVPRAVGALEPLRKLPHFSNLLGFPNMFTSPASHPDVRAAYQAMIDAGIEMEKRQKIAFELTKEIRASGYPAMMSSFGMAPFDVLGDLLRGTHAIFTDIYRRPEKVLEAVEVIADLTIDRIKAEAKNRKLLKILFPLHKGDDTFMSNKQFEKFYWPTLRKVILALNNEGLVAGLFAEGRYTNRLEQVAGDMEKGWVNWIFDQTDMTKAKKLLGDKCCLTGNIPTSLMCVGTAQEVKEYCRKIIEICAPGGGYVLAGGATATETNEANLRAVMAAAREYGVY